MCVARGEGRPLAGKLKPKRPRADPAPPRHVTASPLDTLKRRGVLNIWEHTAADEIIAAHQIASGNPVRRDPDLGIVPGPARSDAADAAAARRCDILVTFATWKADLSRSWYYAVCMRVLIDEHNLSSVDTWGGWRKGTAKGYLLTGLRHFAALRGNVPPRASDWKVDNPSSP